MELKHNCYYLAVFKSLPQDGAEIVLYVKTPALEGFYACGSEILWPTSDFDVISFISEKEVDIYED